jgi:Golgi-body localisation protein domain/RNA pol II promoter Fmp27 protein domain
MVDLVKLQYELFQQRRSELSSVLESLEKTPKPFTNDVLRDIEVVRAKLSFLNNFLRTSDIFQYNAMKSDDVSNGSKREGDRRRRETTDSAPSHEQVADEPASATSEITHFKNRFIVHNLQLKWHNDVRNVIFSYIHQISRRRGFMYYMSQRAVRFLADIVQEQRLHQEKRSEVPLDDIPAESRPSLSAQPDDVAQLIQLLLDDKKDNFVVLDETQQSDSFDNPPGTAKRLTSIDLGGELEDLYAVKNEYSVHLIGPQIQLQSQKNADAAVIMSAESMYLQIFAIMGKDAIDDDVGGLIQRRFMVGMDNAQFFIALRHSFAQFSHRSMLSNAYGADLANWPPWIPAETVFDLDADPLPFARMVEPTSASLRYDKHNPLRLKLNDHAQDDIFRSAELASLTPLDRRVDDISVHFPRVVVTADSAQYLALYLIATDLLIYSEPLVKRQNVELEKIMLASDFSDLTGSPEMVKSLQDRLRQLEEIDLQFLVNAASLDLEGCKDQILLRNELNSSEEELFFLMKAVTMSQEKRESEAETVPTMRWYLSAREVIWHMVRDDKSPMMDLGLSNATYRRYDHNDSSNYNTLEVEMMQGINLLPNCLYTDVLGPYFGSNRTVVDAQRSKMVRVYWHMLESIGGIPIMDHFEVNLFPMMVKIEYEFGKKVFEYMLPELKLDASRNGSARRQRQDADDSDTESDLDSAERSTITSSQTSVASSASKHSKRPPSNGGPPLNRMSPLHMIGEEREKAETVSIASKHSGGSETSRPTPHKPAFDERDKDGEKEKNSLTKQDDLTQMLARASQNITLIYVKVPSTVLCLSYKVIDG